VLLKNLCFSSYNITITHRKIVSDFTPSRKAGERGKFMERLDLSGTWSVRRAGGQPAEGCLPGSNYPAYIQAGLLPDPFWGLNEEEGTAFSKSEFTFERRLELTKEQLGRGFLELVVSGLDTLCTVSLNGEEVAKTDNCFRTWRIPLKPKAVIGDNRLALRFENPWEWMQKRNDEYPLMSASPAKGIGYLRKVQCHFGWDWGPKLPPCGVFGGIAVESYDSRISDVHIRQFHEGSAVRLTVQAERQNLDGLTGSLQDITCTLTAPDGETLPFARDSNTFVCDVQRPRLWWTNGLGEQPLYTVTLKDSITGEEVSRRIGLRTVELDTAPDRYGAQFRFVVNGVPIFAKGADWIPTDAFVTRTTGETLRRLVSQAAWANMNMLRIWGGGHYESDAFYDLCDEFGILVWQDLAFACGAYPFYDPEFLENVKREIRDNVRRIRHHASLALWSGNNENELFTMVWKKKEKIAQSNTSFYYDTAREAVFESDPDTPYWPGSPSSGRRDLSPLDYGYGDTHLWEVWHGLMPIGQYRKMPTRFCSEFGLESFPSMAAIRSFTDKRDIDYLDPVMLGHQKSVGGNQKTMFYLLSRYRCPNNMQDMVYLSQLSQADAMETGVRYWRRNFGRCNGALYWQYNDCWPVASWAGIDYLGVRKALHYRARHFFKPLCLSADLTDECADIWLLNETPEETSGTLTWSVMDFKGTVLSSGRLPARAGALTPERVARLPWTGKGKKDIVLTARYESGGALIDSGDWLAVSDRDADFEKPAIDTGVTTDGETAAIRLTSDRFARRVELRLDGEEALFSDNFFDILPGEPVRVTLPWSRGAGELREKLRIRSMADVKAQGTRARDSLKRFAMRFQKTNLVTFFGYKLIGIAFRQRKENRQ